MKPVSNGSSAAPKTTAPNPVPSKPKNGLFARTLLAAHRESSSQAPPPLRGGKRNSNSQAAGPLKKRRVTQQNKKRELARSASQEGPLKRPRTGNKTLGQKIQGEIRSLGLRPNVFESAEGIEGEDIETALLNHLKSSLAINTLSHLLQKTFRYETEDGELHHFKLTYERSEKSMAALVLERIGPPSQPSPDIVVIDSTRPSVQKFALLSKKIEKELLDNFKELEQEVAAQGYWQLSPKLRNSQLASAFQEIYGPKNAPPQEEVERTKKLFAEDSFLLERFCFLKIKEIASYIANKEKFKPARAPIGLSIIRHEGKEVSVSEVEISFFQEKLAVMPTQHKRAGYPSVIEALFKSSWLVDESAQTIIRFSDHKLEDNLVVQKYCGRIAYGLLSSIILQKKGGELNFWEDLAFNWKRWAKSDFAQIELVKNRLRDGSSNREVELDPEIGNLTTFKGEIDQSACVSFILKNQLSGRGTLLNLPTGSGKTFIIFMAAAQQIKNIGLKNKKPCLVIAPATNVVESWKKNHQLWKGKLQAEADSVFPHDGKLATYDKQDDFFRDFKNGSLQSNDFVVLTQKLLASVVDKLFAPGKEPEGLQRYKVLLTLSGILSANGFILGDAAFWKKQIERLRATFGFREEVLRAIENLVGKQELKPLFYPISRKGELDVNRLNINRTSFVQQMVNVLNGDLFPEAFLSKITICDESGQPAIDLEMLFNYCHFWFQGDAVRGDSKVSTELLALLNNMVARQKLQFQNYEKFKEIFNGIIIDESDQVFVLDPSGRPTKQTRILLDIAKTFQVRAVKDHPGNPLIIASSATPWPNEMDELKLHMMFLLAKLMGEYSHLHEDLFARWKRFESDLDKLSEKALSREGINDHVQAIQSHFHQWVRLLFSYTVSYAKPVAGQTNNSVEKIMYISCDESCYVRAGADTLRAISNFYSNVLRAEDPENKGRNLQQQIFNSLNKKEKFAFYVELTEDAAYLAGILSDYYKEVLKESDPQIGLFYNESFVKKQKGVDPAHTNVTYNTNRMVNINCFNNTFCFKDFYKYLNQHFGTLEIAKNWQSVELLVEAVRCAKDKRGFPKAPKGKSALQEMVHRIVNAPQGTTAFSRLFQGKERNLYIIISRLIALEERSRSQLIMDFSKELERFSDCFPEQKRKEGAEACFKDSSKRTNAALQKVKGGQQGWNGPVEQLIDALFHYLNKINQSKVLIFGNAGTSGMSIHAGRMTAVSGAWTVGKMDQFKGRVGRADGEGKSRPCQITLPITDTQFEFFILRFYIKKALYDLFITGRENLDGKEICKHLILSGLLKAYYDEINPEGGGMQFLNGTIHEIVKKRVASSKDYLALGPYKKALKIIPAEVREQFEKIEEELLSGVDSMFGVQPQAAIEEASHEEPEVHSEVDRAEGAFNDDPMEVVREQLPAVNRGAVRETRKISKPPRPPRIMPAANADWSFDEIEAAKNFLKRSPQKETIIFIVPTRGGGYDIALDAFADHIQESLGDRYNAIVIFGLNREYTQKGQEKPPELKASHRSDLFVKMAPFTWHEEDRWDGKPPIGHMRNFCLKRAEEIWRELTGGSSPLKKRDELYLFSMDGDTKITRSSFERAIGEVSQKEKKPYTVATGGYKFALDGQAWPQRSNAISMRINSKLVDGNSTYFGYLSEPLIAISPPLASLLLEKEKDRILRNEESAPFGFWDCEGRRLLRYLTGLTAAAGVQLNGIGPPSDGEQQPILQAFERFAKVQGPSFPIKPQLRKQELAELITKLFSQAQHSIQPRVIGTNIAYIYTLKNAAVRKFAAYFYAKTLLNLLNLGPRRGNEFAGKISVMYSSEPIPYTADDKVKFGLTEEAFGNFVRENFSEGQVAKLSAEGATEQKRREFKSYSPPLAGWCRIVFENLMREFGETYQEERDEKGHYVPMATPAEYPWKAAEIISEDEGHQEEPDQAGHYVTVGNPKKETIIDITGDDDERGSPAEMISRVAALLQEKHQVCYLSKNNPPCKKLIGEYPEVKKIGVIESKKVILLDFQAIATSVQQRTVCQKILREMKVQFPTEEEKVAICISSVKGVPEVIFGYLHDDIFAYTKEPAEKMRLPFTASQLLAS